MKLAALIAIFACAGLSEVAAQGGTYTNFSRYYETPAQFEETSVTLSPYPLCINKPFCVTLTGNLSTAIIPGAVYQIYGRYLGRLFYSDRDDDLCASLAAAGTPCPIAIGTNTLTLCRNVKPNLPPNFPVLWYYTATNGDGGVITSQKSNSVITAKNCS
ncbi:hypothetical protein BGZ97_010098 [Linnemannia gamsii]|uniref:Phosphatidylglycerol/phosphatidylinositol transfer protein n=1 Tax=Linnemannia gamsii TaxID=64522 RepID=A0A9P6UCV8_9FUNG|nr:hypothetical protein BGZ97_010098 [Linnemannia gamsii]